MKNLRRSINKNLIEQAIGNLIDNAIKYSDKKTKLELDAHNDKNETYYFSKG